MSDVLIASIIDAAAILAAVYLGVSQLKVENRRHEQTMEQERRKYDMDLAKFYRDEDEREERKRFKIQFDVDCNLFRKKNDGLIVEVLFKITNRGIVEQRIVNTSPYQEQNRGLQLLIKGLDDSKAFPTITAEGRLKFTQVIFGSKNIMQDKYNFWFIRPGVEQTITHVVYIEEEKIPQMLQIGGRFYYDETTPHEISRIFPVPAESPDTWEKVYPSS